MHYGRFCESHKLRSVLYHTIMNRFDVCPEDLYCIYSDVGMGFFRPVFWIPHSGEHLFDRSTWQDEVNRDELCSFFSWRLYS